MNMHSLHFNDRLYAFQSPVCCMQSLPRVIVPWLSYQFNQYAYLLYGESPNANLKRRALCFLSFILFLFCFFVFRKIVALLCIGITNIERGSKMLHQQKYYPPFKMPTLRATTVRTTSLYYNDWVYIYVGVTCKAPDAKTRTYGTKAPPDSWENGQPGRDAIPKRAI